jgi:phytoene dehydrogenase-like protein
VERHLAVPLELDREPENWTSRLFHNWNCTAIQFRSNVRRMDDARPQVTVVGGGLAGLTAAIACAEGGARVHLVEAHESLGGRGRSADGPYKANLGPHVIYRDGPLWRWLQERRLDPPAAGPPLSGIRFRWDGAVRRTPPFGALPAVLRLRGRQAPVDRDFRSWAAEHTDDRTAAMLSAAAGVYTFHHDPGALSAAFVWKRTIRALLSAPPPARYVIGGWSALVRALERHARDLGVSIETGRRVSVLPHPPVILATELADARVLLGDGSLDWPSGHTVCLDLAIRSRRGDPFVVSDLDEAGWIERFTAPDPSLAPSGEELLQAQMPVRPGESADQAERRLERLLDASIDGWRERETWRRRLVMDGRTGALDPPGSTWRDRPAVDRGGGVFLAGDMVAADGMLSEVAWASAVEAARLAIEAVEAEASGLERVA